MRDLCDNLRGKKTPVMMNKRVESKFKPPHELGIKLYCNVASPLSCFDVQNAPHHHREKKIVPNFTIDYRQNIHSLVEFPKKKAAKISPFWLHCDDDLAS